MILAGGARKSQTFRVRSAFPARCPTGLGGT